MKEQFIVWNWQLFLTHPFFKLSIAATNPNCSNGLNTENDSMEYFFFLHQNDKVFIEVCQKIQSLFEEHVFLNDQVRMTTKSTRDLQ